MMSDHDVGIVGLDAVDKPCHDGSSSPGGSPLGRPYRYTVDKDKLLLRLRRIEGQVRGVQRMVAEGRYCLDIVQQLQAISSAADEVALLVIQDHIAGCVSDAIRERRGEPAIQELMDVLRRAVRR
ncbi:MAG TPA: metal-sensitive transcriptional regulator [Chloroflexota bacterium]